MSEPSVRLEGVTKRFDDFVAVRAIDLEIGQGEFFTMLGPSGCGKTTTLRMIAGFEQPTDGRVQIEGADVAGLPPHKRPTNTVFQSYALFPHMTVADNVGYGLKRQRARQGRDHGAASPPSSSGSASPSAGTRSRRSSPAGCSSASRSRGRWSTCRRSCCSTSRSARST